VKGKGRSLKSVHRSIRGTVKKEERDLQQNRSNAFQESQFGEKRGKKKNRNTIMRKGPATKIGLETRKRRKDSARVRKTTATSAAKRTPKPEPERKHRSENQGESQGKGGMRNKKGGRRSQGVGRGPGRGEI